MLIELAVGDAYGAGFEYVDSDRIRRYNDLSRYVKHPRHSTNPGEYTDDTQMSLAIAEAIVSGEVWTPENLAAHFVEAFKRDPRVGYAGGFHSFLKQIKDGAEFVARIIPTSDKSGAAMRAAPVGVFPTVETVINNSRIQATLTHNTPDGVNAAIAAALMAHYFIYRLGPKDHLGDFLESHVAGKWAKAWRGKVGPKGWMSVKAAITAIQKNSSLKAVLKACIDFSGDVDTVAAIALAAASCSGEIEQDLPDHLIQGLENGSYGREYIQALDQRLMAMVSRKDGD